MPTIDHMRMRRSRIIVVAAVGLLAALATTLALWDVLPHAAVWAAVAATPLLIGLWVFDRLRADRTTRVLVRAQVVASYMTLLAERDAETAEHSVRVAELSVRVGARLGFDAERSLRLHQMALLHDLGKVAIDNGILRGDGQLTREEFEVVRAHPEISARLVRSFVDDPEAAEIVLCHHERYDGEGYLQRDRTTVPLESFVVAVCDSFDAMTSARSYHDAMDAQSALAEIARNSGTQFHPDAAAALLTELQFEPSAVPTDGVKPTEPASRYNDVVLRPEWWRRHRPASDERAA